MRMSWIPTLLVCSGCVGAPATRSRDYDTMLGDLRREATARPDGDAAISALVSSNHLDRAALIRAVLARNPGVRAMREAWRAATAEIPAAGVLDDPMVTYEIAPGSVAGSAPFGQRVKVTQKLPFPGKRGLAGDVAVSEAAVARDELRATTLALAALASTLYDDYALAEQELAVNDHHRMITLEMQKAVEAQLAGGRGSTQDSLAAEVELGRMAQDRLMIESRRAAVVAQLDGLLHRAPEAPLPAPVDEPIAPAEPPSLEALVETAAARPDAAVAGERIAAGSAQVAIAERAFYPDLELMGSYDSMWDLPAHRWMLGVSVEVPLQRGKRQAAVDAARARVAEASAELERIHDDVRVEVFRARRDVVESNALVASYDHELLPAARAQVDAALQGFVIGRNDFTAVIAAERGARELELAAFRARAELSKRRAALDRATGRLPGGGAP
jgi:outer membrane protein, heavy metal efflux system